MKQRQCANCHKMFILTEKTACFMTCPDCRRPYKGKRKVPIFRTNSGYSGWDEGGNSWDNAVSRIEGD